MYFSEILMFRKKLKEFSQIKFLTSGGINTLLQCFQIMHVSKSLKDKAPNAASAVLKE